MDESRHKEQHAIHLEPQQAGMDGESEEERLAARVEALRHRIEEANYEYYILDNPTLTDAEYDQLMMELQRIEREHPELVTPESPTQRVGTHPHRKCHSTGIPSPC